MSGHLQDRRLCDSTRNKLQAAIALLLEAYQYAVDTESDPWDFAVAISDLQALGLNKADLRWLTRKGYVEHAREITVQGENGREFRQTGNLTFARRTCFVLTDLGVSNATSHPSLAERPSRDAPIELNGNGRALQTEKPIWDLATRRLRVNTIIVKHFRWPAPNQETVLTAFEEDGWPERIDDPLPPQQEQDSRRRLSDTIKCLNRKQVNSLLHFRGDGTGEGVLWEFVDEGSIARQTQETPHR